MQNERFGARAVLLSELNDWSVDYSRKMTRAGVLTHQRDAIQSSVDYRNFEYYLIPVNGPRDFKFRLVENMAELDLTVIVLANQDIGAVAALAERCNAICFKKSNEPEDIMAVANWIKRNQASVR